MPFAAILTAYGFWRLLHDGPPNALRAIGFIRWRTLLVGAFSVLLLLEADGVRFRRSEEAIRAVSLAASHGNAQVVALEEAWRAGGRLFLMRTPVVLELEPAVLESADALERFVSDRHVDVVGITAMTATRRGYADLLVRCGFTEEHRALLRPTYRVFYRQGQTNIGASH
jgi:hypothetical protein